MDVIRFHTKLKAEGKEYARIVFWNRFWRNKTELILTLLPAVICIILFCLGFNNTYLLILYVVVIAYPFMIYSQCKGNIRYHLKNRDASESASCEMTLMETGILAEIPEFAMTYNYHWSDFTTIYDVLGFYMMFQKGKMIVMLRKADIPEELADSVRNYIFEHVNQNECLVKIHK